MASSGVLDCRARDSSSGVMIFWSSLSDGGVLVVMVAGELIHGATVTVLAGDVFPKMIHRVSSWILQASISRQSCGAGMTGLSEVLLFVVFGVIILGQS